MPGIVGVITTAPREQAARELSAMLAALQHESFYVSSQWIDEGLGVYAGCVARRGSFSDGMPVHNELRDVTLVFSGEDYPDPRTATYLRARGHIMDTDGPSYLVHQYEDDPTFPACVNGRFHGLLIDRRQGTVLLFNDRYGLQRIYYHEGQDAFYFAAEAKAILAVRPELRSADLHGLGEFVSCGCVLENRTIFTNLHVLPPASAWLFRRGTACRKGVYFQPQEWEVQTPLTPEAYYQELKEVFSAILPRYFTGPERIGVSLTGGLDTRMIMAWRKSTPGSLQCYSFGGMFRDCQDVRVARRVADVCQQPHQVIPVGEDFLNRFPYYAERSVYLTDGCIDVSHSADLYVNERVSQVAPVRMTGNYGGEVLRRVRAFKPVEPASELFVPEFLTHIERASAVYARLLQEHPLSFAVFRQAPWHHYGLLSLEQTQIVLRSPFLDNAFVRTVFQAPQSACVTNDISLRLIADGNPQLARIPTDRGLLARKTLSSMALNSLMNFTAKAEYAYDYGMPQWVARIDHLFSSLHLERVFLGRHKFYHYRVWYRDSLSAYVREILLDERTLSRPYLIRHTVEDLVRKHARGDHNYTSEIHKLLTLELIFRLFVDSH